MIMNMKILGLALFLILAVGTIPGLVQGAVWYEPITALEDSVSGWTADALFTLSLSTTVYKTGTGSAKCITQEGATDGLVYYYDYGSGQDLTNYEVLAFYFKGSNTGHTLTVMVRDTAGVNSVYALTDDSATWEYHELRLNAPTFDKSGVRYIIIVMAGSSEAGTYYLDRVQFKDTQTTMAISGDSDLRDYSVYLNQTATYGLTANANETGGKIAILGFNGGVFKFINGSQVITVQNITSDTLDFYPNATVVNWRVSWDPDTEILTLSMMPDLDNSLARSVFSISNFVAWINAQWGIGAYLVLMLVPISLFIKTREPGIPIIFLMFLGAGGLVLPEATGLRPLVILVIIAVFSLGAYRVFWPKDG